MQNNQSDYSAMNSFEVIDFIEKNKLDYNLGKVVQKVSKVKYGFGAHPNTQEVREILAALKEALHYLNIEIGYWQWKMGYLQGQNERDIQAEWDAHIQQHHEQTDQEDQHAD